MDVSKIVRLVAVLFAVVAGVARIPESAMIIAILGLVAGWFITEEDSLAFLVSAIALGVCYGALGAIPALGGYLTAILGSLSALFYAGACTVIVMRTFRRLKP